MSVLFGDGVGYYDTTSLQAPKRWTGVNVYSSWPTVESSDGPFGDKWIKTFHSSWVRRSLGAIYNNELFLNTRYKNLTGTAAQTCVAFLDGTSEQCDLLDNGGTLQARRGGTVLGTASIPCVPNTWQQLEIRVIVDDSAGVFQVKLDGVLVINVTGADTQYQASSGFNVFGLGGYPSYNNQYQGFTHIVAMDTQGSYCNGWIGNRRVQVLMPTGAGALSEFTPSAGDNYQCVDEVPPNETDYNESDAAGERDTFTTGNVANSNASVDAVISTMYAKTDDGGAASAKGLVRTGTPTIGEGNEVSVPSSYGYVDSVIYVDPDTSLPFTVANINSYQKGYKRQS